MKIDFMEILYEINFTRIYYSLFMAFVFVFPARMLTKFFARLKGRQQSAVEKAIARGHVVNAVYKKRIHYFNRSRGRYITSAGLYEYTYKGKTYTRRIYYKHRATPPNTEKLYFLKNPRKAVVENDLEDSEVNWLLVYVIVAVVWFLILNAINFEI